VTACHIGDISPVTSSVEICLLRLVLLLLLLPAALRTAQRTGI